LDIHVTPTIDGNVLIGPTCTEVVDSPEFNTTGAGLTERLEKGGILFEGMRPDWQIRNFCGIFPKPVDSSGNELDFQIESRPELPGLINLVGITSPGFTGAYPIALYIAAMIGEHEELIPNPGFNPLRRGIVSFADKNDEERARLIEQDPNYGEIVCRCECITRAEILQALKNPLGICSVNGIKYRTRASMGRCQGGYCETRITSILRQEPGISETDIRLNGPSSYLFTGKVRA
jgi:glycerol-3-phosphate dehydrogenase